MCRKVHLTSIAAPVDDQQVPTELQAQHTHHFREYTGQICLCRVEKKLVCPNGISHNSLLRDGEMSRRELWALFSCIVSAACERSVQCACHTL